MNRLFPFRGFTSFRARVFWSVVPIIVGFLIFQSWMNIREHRRLVTEEFEKRGQALAANLGFASELGARPRPATITQHPVTVSTCSLCRYRPSSFRPGPPDAKSGDVEAAGTYII